MNAPAAAQAVSDYRELAQHRLPENLWQYLDQGDDGHNARAFASTRLMPRPLLDVRGGNTRLMLFGQALEHPLLLAPVAYQRLFNPDGETASAAAAAAQGGQMVVSSLASQPFTDIIAAGRSMQGPAPWFQLYWQGDRQRTQRLLQRAVDAGCSAVVFTVDAPVKRARFRLPGHVTAVNLDGTAETPPPQPPASAVFDGWMAQAPAWRDVEWLRSQTALPLLLKGILHPDDAACAAGLGCDGVIVSNHGGRVLDGTIPSLEALPAMLRRLDGRIPVLVDSGIRSGRDAFVALAHGAAAVLVGRPAIWGLSAAGAMGVAQVIRLMRDELEMTMALAGCARLTDIKEGCLC